MNLERVSVREASVGEDAGRPLGSFEALMWRSSMNIVGFAEVRGPMTAERLRGALDRVQHVHETLQIQVSRSPAGDVFRRSETPIPLATQTCAGPEDARRAAEFELNRAFLADDGPLIRVSLLSHETKPDSCWIVIAIQHAIADGNCVLQLVGELLDAANLADFGDAGSLEPPPRPLLPAMEAMAEAPVEDDSPAGLLLEILKRRARLGAARRLGDAMLGELKLPAFPKPGQNRLILSALSELETAKLIDAQFRRGCSLQGLLCAAVHRAVEARFPALAGEALNIVQPINLRAMLRPKIDSRQMGMYVFTPTICGACSPGEDLWTSASRMREYRAAQAGKQVLLSMMAARGSALHSAGLTSTSSLESLVDPLAPVLLVSNKGMAFTQVTHGRFELADFLSVAGGDVVYALYVFAMVYNRKLRLGFVYCESLLKGESARSLADATLEGLARASRTGGDPE